MREKQALERRNGDTQHVTGFVGDTDHAAHRARGPILRVYRLGPLSALPTLGAAISEGYPDGMWRPYESVTRAQFTKMAVIALGVELATPMSESFTDVPTSDVYYQYIEGAKAAGLIAGVTPGEFSPTSRLLKITARNGSWLVMETKKGLIDGDSRPATRLSGLRAAGIPPFAYPRHSSASRFLSLTRLKQAQVKVNTARTFSCPRCLSLRRPPVTFIQPKGSSTILRRRMLTP